MAPRKQKPAPKSWDAGLPEMPFAGVPWFYATPQGQVDALRQLEWDRKHVMRSEMRLMLDARRLRNCLEHIGRLPEPGESFHLITQNSLFDVLRATLTLAAPATIRYLAISTLSFSPANMESLVAMLDRGQVGKLDFLYSLYFKSNEREVCEALAADLTHRGQRVLSMRTHCKLLLMQLADERALTVESSAILRSCSNIEQISITHDRGLFDFHVGWINDVFSQ